MNKLSNYKIRKGRCPQCGKVFDVMPCLEASAEIPVSGVRPMGEPRNKIKDVNRVKLSVKCPWCRYEYSEERTII